MTDAPLWAVVATVREPVPLIAAFARHHLALGATEVHLCFDDPTDPAADALTGMPGLRVLRCDAAHWARLGGRPPLQTGRQRLNATRVAAEAMADWLLHIDADEFLDLRRPLAEDLARLGPEDLWLKLPVAERVWVAGQPEAGLFDGAFRLPFPAVDPEDPRIAQIYGQTRGAFLGRGMAGHAVGKGLTRLRAGLEIGVHAPVLPSSPLLPQGRTAWHAKLLHFDGLTPEHWVSKSRRYAAAASRDQNRLLHPSRLRQITHIRDACPDDTSTLAFHQSLFRISLDEAAALDALDLLHYAHIPNVGDLSPAAFASAPTAG